MNSSENFSEIEKTLDKYCFKRINLKSGNYLINNLEMGFFIDNISSFTGVVDLQKSNYLYVSESCLSVLGLNRSDPDLYGKENSFKATFGIFYPGHAVQFTDFIFPTFLKYVTKIQQMTVSKT